MHKLRVKKLKNYLLVFLNLQCLEIILSTCTQSHITRIRDCVRLRLRVVCECKHNISSHARPKNIVTTAINAATEYVGAASKSPLEQSIFKPEPSTERHVSAGINESTDVPVQSEFVYTFD